ncbi:MAG: hypothetical protein VYD71_00705 [Bacteroidota bacterium]|nr:hypothetical protein [Bacteroidota bacterium]
MKKTIIFLSAILVIAVVFIILRNRTVTTTIKPIKVYRFEESLFATNESQIENDITEWKLQLGPFFNNFNYEILRANSKQEIYKQELLQFVSHPDMREAFDTLIAKYSNVDFLKKELAIAFDNYKKHFPKKKEPAVITYFSGFNFGVVTSDTILAIGLDYFLGKNCSFYKRLNSPEYMREMNQKKFILPFCFEAIANNEFNDFDSEADFLSQMIFKGKIMYFIDVMLPKISKADKLRFDKNQFSWCEENEKDIWAFFIDNELLYTTDIKRFNSYINYAPFAKDMPKDSPGRIAYYIGWNIVNDYMGNNPTLSLQALIQNINAQEILQQSGYKP